MTEDETAQRGARRIEAAYARRGGSGRYAPTNPAHRFMIQDRERRVLSRLAREGWEALGGYEILEVGCGRGDNLLDLIRWGAHPGRLHGVDLLEERLEAARCRLPGSVDLQHADAAALPWASSSFDLVLQSTVFTSILETDLKRRVATEMLRVLRSQGAILWYDFAVDNPRNPDVSGVPVSEIRNLFPSCSVKAERVTLAPPLTRFFAPWSWIACATLQLVPFLRTHRLAWITPMEESRASGS